MRRFTCPKCGGHAFGTINHYNTPREQWIRACNGWISEPQDDWKGMARCNFEWPIADDDKYMVYPPSSSSND